ncbi:unnamed protein product [Eretmochelys imbricata]
MTAAQTALGASVSEAWPDRPCPKETLSSSPQGAATGSYRELGSVTDKPTCVSPLDPVSQQGSRRRLGEEVGPSVPAGVREPGGGGWTQCPSRGQGAGGRRLDPVSQQGSGSRGEEVGPSVPAGVREPGGGGWTQCPSRGPEPVW